MKSSSPTPPGSAGNHHIGSSRWLSLPAFAMGILLAASLPAEAQSPLRIMPLGDSITRGSNGMGSIPGGYRKQLGIRLAGAGIAYDFVGTASDNAAAGMDPNHQGYDGFRTDQSLGYIQSWLASNPPDVVTMHLGTNDLIQGVPIPTVISNLEKLIQQITANAPARRLHVATIIPIIDTRNGHTPQEWSQIIGAYNTEVRNLVRNYANMGRNVNLVEMNGSLVYTNSDPSKNFFQYGDGTHPGQAGYNQMGDVWFAAIGSGVTPPPPPTGTQNLANGSFESDFAGWSGSGNLAIQSSGGYTATDGGKLVAFNAGNSAPNGILSQTFATTAGTTYSLTFDAGVFAYNTAEQRIQVTAAGFSQVVSVSGAGNGGVRWARQNFSFTANSGSTTLTFRDVSPSTNALDLLLDNVRVNGGNGGGTPSNSAPVAASDSYSTARNTQLVIPANGVLANDADPQSQPLTAILKSNPANGSVSLSSNGGFSYTPASGFTGSDSFTYQAHDGSLGSNIVAVAITVNAPSSGGLANGSFESGFTGWSMAGNAYIANAAPYTSTHGSKLVAFNNANTPANAVISQSIATVAGATYTIDFDIGVLSYNGNSQTLQVIVAGGNTLLSQTSSLYGSGNGTRWENRRHTFTADSSTTTITFRDLSSSTNSLDLLLDDVQLIGP